MFQGLCSGCQSGYRRLRHFSEFVRCPDRSERIRFIKPDWRIISLSCRLALGKQLQVTASLASISCDRVLLFRESRSPKTALRLTRIPASRIPLKHEADPAIGRCQDTAGAGVDLRTLSKQETVQVQSLFGLLAVLHGTPHRPIALVHRLQVQDVLGRVREPDPGICYGQAVESLTIVFPELVTIHPQSDRAKL